MPRVLIADDEENIRFTLHEVLRRELTSCQVDEARDGVQALEFVEQNRYDLVMLDIRMPRMDGMAALKKMREIDPDIIVVIITAHGTQKLAMEALQAGAYDYFTKPFELNEVRIVVRRAIEKSRLLRQLEHMRSNDRLRYSFDEIIGQSSSMQDVFNLIERVLDNDVTVLVTGESGTGKELVASAIHKNSARTGKPLIKVNTAAIPEQLLESELFGHERGAFTGAIAQKVGKVEAAHGGTLFLDEIGDMSFPLQAKLLRVLQEREIERVGSTKVMKVDIRVIAATNRDLALMVEKGEFREDLYYRLNVLPIHLPPLRKRRDDVPLLIDYFIGLYNPRLKRNVSAVSEGALQKLLNYAWPGNIRELENTIQRTMLMAKSNTIQTDDLPPTLLGENKLASRATSGEFPEASEVFDDLDLKSLLATDDFSHPLADRLQSISDHIEKYLIRAALKSSKGHRQETADLLGISRKSLHNKMVRYNLFDEPV
ncbi:MAG: sigma-54-dependent Fis family transcriptional regulator [Candidatus Sumerlaeia bacterium]|nr:sigma-54-dependent Fis family transcriptional regulator [Candidatus Sumerlaeia bacterium]